ncbi:VQ motif-containing protein 22-like [Dioscorea cayenensis subsp. rotundata]|uniref:VQ motif-containing protein 22-like n=1 Tax=Dioscorea cayennensis subsp. rotundata TaxID=55577 RepID=A0AB40D5I4_DIOCR|nr:VQ motif-containing protein 22-like [Dioscorea cayenensis subsp. rotundata]
MAMSDTSSTPPDWAQLYHRNMSVITDQTSPNMFGSGSTGLADSTIVTSTASFSSQTISQKTTGGPISNIEGRVGKSPRRRSRASRKAPTTLLNTDTTNFRAMVQQFTGIPSAPYSSSAIQTNGPPFINFGLGINDTINFTNHAHQPHYFNNNNNNNNNNNHHHIRPQQQQQQHQQGTMFMLDNMTSSNNNEGGFFLDVLPGQTTAPPRPASSNGFLF